MNGRFLLDTNIIIGLFANDSTIYGRLSYAIEIFIPCITIGELYFGAYKSTKIQENLTRINEFVRNNTILSCDTDTAQKYGDIKNRLKEKGQPIPENDIWVAAIARQYDLTLVTRDSHFLIIEDLRVEIW